MISGEPWPSLAWTVLVTHGLRVISPSRRKFALPFVRLIAPNGGETWTIGSLRTILWSSNIGGNVKLELSRNGGTTWSGATVLNDGSQNWTVTGPASTNCLIRVTSTTAPAATDTSDANFTIL